MTGPDGVFVHPRGLCESSEVGAGTRVWAFAHVLPGARVGRDCNICDGAFVETGASLGDRVTVKNAILVFDGVTCEDDVFLGPNVLFTNDLRPRAAIQRGGAQLLATTVRRGATLGAGVVVVCGIRSARTRSRPPARWSPGTYPRTPSWPATRPGTRAGSAPAASGWVRTWPAPRAGRRTSGRPTVGYAPRPGNHRDRATGGALPPGTGPRQVRVRSVRCSGRRAVTMLSTIRRTLGGLPPAQAAYRAALTSRTVAQRWTIGAASSRRGPRRGRILAYHSIGTPYWGINDVSPRHFERHLQIAVDDGWSFATPAQVIAEPDRPLLAVTFDDGVASVLTGALPVLRHHGIPATAFIVTGWSDGQAWPGRSHILDWPGVRALHEAGVRIASHSVSHPDFSRLSEAQARQELEESRSRLVEMTGVDTDEFALPFGQSGNWSEVARRAAAGAGYRTLYAQAVNTRPAGTVPRTFITRVDRPMLFRAALAGAFDDWEE